MKIYILNVGCGNMNLILLPENSIFMFDCNITNDNEKDVLNYVENIIGKGTKINVFINSHRDADHMRGIKTLHKHHTISKIWDTGVPGTTTDSTEYKDYMDLKRKISSKEIEARKYWTYGDAKLRIMNSKWEDYSEPNDQSIVMKIEYKGASYLIAGDTSYKPWQEKILTHYSDSDLKSDILLASHHGSLTFFDDPSDSKSYYKDHIKKIKPAMTLISVGPNSNDLPNDTAVKIYKENSSGSDKGNKLFTTEDKGNMKLTLKEDGGWSLSINQ